MEDILYKNSPSDVRIREMVSIIANQNKRDYSKDYLTFKALEDCQFSFTVANGIDDEDYLQSAYVKAFYSFDEKNWVEWTTTQYKSVLISVSANENLYVKAIPSRGNLSAYGIYGTIWFNSTGNFNVGGPLDSLLYNNDGITKKEMGNDCYLSKLFQNCSGLVSAENLILPNYVKQYCYSYMFSGCTSLTTAPVLPATTLIAGCYSNMFSGCTSLTTAPVLSATTLANYCYQSMFSGCTSLTTAPVLPATTLANSCYNSMFQNCSNLNYIKAMFTTTPSNTYTQNWVNGVSTEGTFVKNSAATWKITGNNGVPTGWTVETVDS